MIVAFLILGLFAWSKIDISFSFDRFKKFDVPFSFDKSFDRNPTAVKNKAEKFVVKKIEISDFKPDLKVFESKRADDSLRVVQDNQYPSLTAEPLKTSNFETTRNEINLLMSVGKLDEALDLARSRLEENVSTSKEASYLGYLQDFIMQNMHDPEEQYNFTYSSVKNAQDPAIRMQFIQKFSVYQPDMADEIKQEILSSGISL